MPKPSLGRGFFRLDRNGDRVIEPSNVEPFDTLVTVVFIDIRLPCPLEPTVYGRPDESVTETAVVPVKKKWNQFNIHSRRWRWWWKNDKIFLYISSYHSWQHCVPRESLDYWMLSLALRIRPSVSLDRHQHATKIWRHTLPWRPARLITQSTRSKLRFLP